MRRATLFSRYGQSIAVVVVTSAAGAVTSWQEFADASRKTERYTRAVFRLKNLLSWWKALTEVEKASKTTISKLIHTAESIISDERVAWVSTADKDDPRKDGANKGEKGSGKKPIVGSLEDENPHALGKYAVPPGR